MSFIPAALQPGSVPSNADGTRPGQITTPQAAQQFEALLLAQMLRTSREASGSEGWLGSGQDSAAASAIGLAEEQFASALAAQGGIGLARLILQTLPPQPSAPPAQPAAPAENQ